MFKNKKWLAAITCIGALTGAFFISPVSAFADEPAVTDTALVAPTTVDADVEAPEVGARLVGELMYISASDSGSGVKSIVVNNKEYSDLTTDELCINVKDYEETDEFLVIFAEDEAGNRSGIYRIKNPFYVGEIEDGAEDKSLSNPYSIEASGKTDAKGTVIEETVNTDSEGVVTKEFYTITAGEKIFYLVVDKQQSQDNVYLLTEAGANDLLNFVNYNGVDVWNGDVPMYELASESIVPLPEITEVTKDGTEPTIEDSSEPPKTNNNSTIIIVVLVCVAGIGIYFFRMKKRKNDISEAGEIDEFDVPDDNDNI